MNKSLKPGLLLYGAFSLTTPPLAHAQLNTAITPLPDVRDLSVIFKDYLPLTREQLDQQRGGFTTSKGLKISIGFESVVVLNGKVEAKSTFYIPQLNVKGNNKSDLKGLAVAMETLTDKLNGANGNIKGNHKPKDLINITESLESLSDNLAGAASVTPPPSDITLTTGTKSGGQNHTDALLSMLSAGQSFFDTAEASTPTLTPSPVPVPVPVPVTTSVPASAISTPATTPTTVSAPALINTPTVSSIPVMPPIAAVTPTPAVSPNPDMTQAPAASPATEPLVTPIPSTTQPIASATGPTPTISSSPNTVAYAVPNPLSTVNVTPSTAQPANTAPTLTTAQTPANNSNTQTTDVTVLPTTATESTPQVANNVAVTSGNQNTLNATLDNPNTMSTVIMNTQDSALIQSFQMLNVKIDNLGQYRNKSVNALILPQIIHSLR